MPVSMLDALGHDELHIIASLLESPDLCNLARVTKQCAGLVERFLYEHLAWDWGLEGHDQASASSIIACLRSILKRPDLGKHVKQINIKIVRSRGYPYGSRTKQDPLLLLNSFGDVKTIARSRLTALCGGYGTKLGEKVTQGHMDAFMAVLLGHAPRLRSLTVDDERDDLGGLITETFRIAMLLSTPGRTRRHRLPTFANLEEVSMTTKERHSKQRSSLLHERLIFFYLTNLKRLSVTLSFPVQLGWPLGRPPLPLTQLTLLSLTQVREHHLPAILSLTPNLEELKWELSYDTVDWRQDSDTIVRLDLITTSIHTLAATLTSLTLSGSDASYYSSWRSNSGHLNLQFHGELLLSSTLPKLKALAIDNCYLVGIGSFDRIVSFTLTSLTVISGDRLGDYFGIYEDDFRWLGVWLDGWKLRRPNLQNVAWTITDISYAYAKRVDQYEMLSLTHDIELAFTIFETDWWKASELEQDSEYWGQEDLALTRIKDLLERQQRRRLFRF